jgi:hypothetical protein
MSHDGSTDWHDTAYSTSPVRTSQRVPRYQLRSCRGLSRPSFPGETGRRFLEYEEEAELQEAGAVIANSYLRLDHQEWIRVAEKHSAALQGR